MRLGLITGGTSGIGRSFATTLARDGVDLVLVARDADRLAAVADELTRAHGVRVETMTADLATRAGQDAVSARLSAGDVDVLVNNAGFSLKTPLVGGDDALADAAHEVMGRAPRVLSAAFAAAHGAARPTPAPGSAPTAHVITVASLSALTRQDSYSALKAYTLAMTEVLAVELTGTGIAVTAVLPGWVRTEFHDRGGQGRSSIPGFLWLDPDRVATEALADARAGRVLSIPTKRYKVLAAVLRALPAAGVRAVSRALSGHRKRDRAKPTIEGESA